MKSGRAVWRVCAYDSKSGQVITASACASDWLALQPISPWYPTLVHPLPRFPPQLILLPIESSMFKGAAPNPYDDIVGEYMTNNSVCFDSLRRD